jgi:hypothetical protein
VRRKTVAIPQPIIERAETVLAKHLSSYGPDGANGGGLKLVGGERWWRVRGRALEGEWVEVSSPIALAIPQDLRVSLSPCRCRKTIFVARPTRTRSPLSQKLPAPLRTEATSPIDKAL